MNNPSSYLTVSFISCSLSDNIPNSEGSSLTSAGYCSLLPITKGKCPEGFASPNNISAIALPDSGPAKPPKIIDLTLSRHSRFTGPGEFIITKFIAIMHNI